MKTYKHLYITKQKHVFSNKQKIFDSSKINDIYTWNWEHVSSILFFIIKENKFQIVNE